MGRLSGQQVEELEAIRQRFALKIPEKLRAIDEAARLLRSARPEPEPVERLFQLAHGLAGSAAIFGFRELAGAAAGLETLMTQRPASPAEAAAWRRRVATAVRRMRRSAAR